MPLHFSDSRGVCLQDKNRLLLLEVPNCDEAILVTCNDFSTGSLTPRQAPNSFVALQRGHRLDQAFLARCREVEYCDGPILAASCNIVFRFGHGQSLDLTL